MSEPEPPPSTPKVPVAAIAAMLACYAGLNAACLFVPYIPGTGVFFFRGLVSPAAAIFLTWLWFAWSGRKCGEGLAAAISLTLIFAFAGLATCGICVQIYQSI